MNAMLVRYILGQILKIQSIMLLLPALVALIYQEPNGIYFLITAAICLCFGFAFTIVKPENTTFYLKDGCVATALSWILLSLTGCLPFYFSQEIPHFTDALFETVSGFTTTGATILSDVEALSHCMIFWRSFSHWIGGMGVLVFLIAVVPMSGGSHINLMRAESPGPSVGKFVPKVRYTARILYLIYLALTVMEFVLLLCGKMPLFDAVCTALGTAGTGGFGILNDSMASYSPYIQWVVGIFMTLFAINFNLYYLILFGDLKSIFHLEEVKWFLILHFCAVAAIAVNIFDLYGNLADTIRHAFFQVSTLISSTGFATTDFNQWNQPAKCILVLVMFMGACAGSTGGGIKVSRILIMVKTVFKELNGYIHPKSIKKIKMEGKPVEHEVVRSVNVFFITFMIIFGLSVLLVSFEGYDLVTNFTATLACINNMGPGLNLVGPASNFGFFNDFTKYVLIFDMIAGRLELFPLLILFHPSLWKDLFHQVRRSVKG